MNDEELVKCQNCGRSVLPRLWMIGGDYLTYMTVQHLCAYCGVVMYETGGGYKRRPLIVTIVVICLAIIALLVIVLTHLGR